MPVNIYFISLPHWTVVIAGFLIALGITGITIPSIVTISRIKFLCYTPNSRTSHTNSTPTFGGVAVFAGIIFSTVIMAGTYFNSGLTYIIIGLVIIFFLGIKDDILIIDPLKKLAGQILAASLIAVFADIRITNLYGLFYIGQLPYIASIMFTVFVFIVIINGFNLIDGIDGLASGIGILSASVMGIWFWMTADIAYAIFSFALIGSLSAFFCFNVFGRKNKIFLGDTGSQITGFVIGILACRFLQVKIDEQGVTDLPSAPAVVCGILIVPLFDSLRVFILRIVQGKSPFKADRQHLHHLLLKLNFTHLQATLILMSVNLFFIILSYSLRGIGIIWLTGVITGFASLMSYILVIIVREKDKETIETVHPAHSIPVAWRKRNKMKPVLENQLVLDTFLHSADVTNARLN